MTKNLIAVGAFSLALLTGCVKDIHNVDETNDTAQTPNTLNYVPGQLLVKFKSATPENGRRSLLARINGTVAEQVVTDVMKSKGDNEGFYVVNTPLSTMEAVGRLSKNAEVEYAEPNWIYTLDAGETNDTYIGNLWGMTGTYGSQASVAWGNGHTGSSNVYVGIIDEGYMYTHTDLSANAGTNPYETPNNKKDDDNNGYVDDVYGWDFDGNNNTVFDGLDDDHGTHVAGTIGAVGNNGTGVAGVNWHVKLLSAKFLGKRGGTTANAVKAVDYFTDLKKKGLNLVATNNSWGGGGYSQALFDAIDRANTAGVLFIAAAGNDGADIDASASYPAAYSNSNIISVAAITSTGGLASFSNYGATQVDIGAPGNGIYSTVPARSGRSVASGYASYSGTSMATPHVTGAAALYKSTHTSATAADIKAAILGTATPTGSLAGKCVTGGRLNVSSF
ncbi:MAG: S8 family peptidase [Flavisolibacter sp.]